jgi:hypothetical protein
MATYNSCRNVIDPILLTSGGINAQLTVFAVYCDVGEADGSLERAAV